MAHTTEIQYPTINDFEDLYAEITLEAPMVTVDAGTLPTGHVFRGKCFQEGFDDRKSSWIMLLTNGYHLEFYLKDRWQSGSTPLKVAFYPLPST